MKIYNTDFKIKMLELINSLPGNIVLRDDVTSLGNPRKVSRNLNYLIREGKLIKLGYGIYAKTEENPYLETMAIRGGFASTSLEALDRLGIEWEPEEAVENYNIGSSTQVPANVSVRLKSRYRGNITDGKRELNFKDNINAI